MIKSQQMKNTVKYHISKLCLKRETMLKGLTLQNIWAEDKFSNEVRLYRSEAEDVSDLVFPTELAIQSFHFKCGNKNQLEIQAEPGIFDPLPFQLYC